MPHIVVKMHPGRTAEQKSQLAAAITEAVTGIAGCDDGSVSIAIEEITPEDWAEKVYKPDILEKEAALIKKPGYNPFEP
jgi:4-oxalocrotonate tautomerase